jgi:ABC-type dipeptide/oligopeptide/nickel transport system permease subunit
VVARRFLGSPLSVAGLVGVVLVAIMAFGGGQLWPHDANRIPQVHPERASPSWQHPMGLDPLSRDMLARVLAGMRRSMLVAVVVALLSTAIGVTVGALAGYFGGVVDSVLMRFTDLVLTVPGIAVLAVVAAERNRSWLFVGLVLAGLMWVKKARLVRGMIATLRDLPFVEAARAAGASDARIIWRHLLPNAAAPIIVTATLTVSAAVLAEASLAYLGLGVTPPEASLGQLVSAGQDKATTSPWLFYFPGLTVMVMVVCVSFVGDGLRRALDPRDAPVMQRATGASGTI